MPSDALGGSLLLRLVLTACSGKESPMAPAAGDPAFDHAGHDEGPTHRGEAPRTIVRGAFSCARF
jgi:hypothetical protein